MADDTQGSSTGGGDADPVGALLLGLAAQIDQLAAVIGSPHVPGIDDLDLAALTGRLGELGGGLGELGDLLARLLSAFIAVLEAVAEMMRAAPTDAAPAPTPFQTIPVRITSS